MGKSTVSDSSARSVGDPSTAFIDATSTTTAYVDLLAYANTYVRVTVTTEAHWIATGATNAFTLKSTDTTGFEAHAGTYLAENGVIHFVVDERRRYLGYKSDSGTGVIVVTPT